MARFAVFFFSSRRRHTRSKRDWSSDVCSSDIGRDRGRAGAFVQERDLAEGVAGAHGPPGPAVDGDLGLAVEIGRASCRERVEMLGATGSVKRNWRIEPASATRIA